MVDTAIALAQSSRSRGLFARRLAAHLFMLLFLAAWQAAALVAPSYLLPSPVQVAWRLWSFVTSWRDLGHLGASLYHVAAAIAISFVIGSLLALIPYYVPLLRFAIERRIGPFLNSFSAIGWTLLSIMWFGVSPLTVIFAISAVLVAFALVNMSAGLALVIVPSLYPFPASRAPTSTKPAARARRDPSSCPGRSGSCVG
jgi:NitT/TauT family transport system permease protein/sulfonate transport system permease protein